MPLARSVTRSTAPGRVRISQLRSAFHVATCHRHETPTISNDDRTIAIVGGGITGLSAAFYATQFLPRASIHVYESGRWGGWLRSKPVVVSGNDADVIFEQGPRTLRTQSPSFPILSHLVRSLSLDEELDGSSRSAPANRVRYMFYPDHLVELPAGVSWEMAWGLLTEPLFKGLFTTPLTEMLRPERPAGLVDESVGSFLRRRFGDVPAIDNMASAMLHGIYAGDIDRLSARSLFPTLWAAEAKFGTLGRWLTQPNSKMIPESVYRQAAILKHFPQEKPLFDASFATVSCPKGISTIPDALTAWLGQKPNVQLTNTPVTSIRYRRDQRKIDVATADGRQEYDAVISAVAAPKLAELTNALPSLAKISAVNVMVVNLFFQDPWLVPVGFGYLVPRGIPLAMNPERALGVIFDTHAAPGQDKIPGTKVTVMIGGHWWDGLDKFPDEEEGVRMAQAVLRRHLKISAEPLATQVGVHRNCIPQYHVGHRGRLAQAAHDLRVGFGEQMVVAGNSYDGVSVSDCVLSGAQAAKLVAENKISGGGLDRFETTERGRWHKFK